MRAREDRAIATILILVLGGALQSACGGSVAADPDPSIAGDGGGATGDGVSPGGCGSVCVPELLHGATKSGSLRAAGNSAFFFAKSPDGLVRRSLDSSTTATLASAPPALELPTSLTLSETYAFWLAGESGAVRSAFRASFNPGEVVTRLPISGAIAIAAAPSRLYVGYDNRIDAHSLTGEDPATVFFDIHGLLELDAALGRIVWLEKGLGLPRLRVATPGGSTRDVSTSIGLPCPFSFDGLDVAWATAGSSRWTVSVLRNAADVPSQIADMTDEVVAVGNDAVGVVVATRTGVLFEIAADGAKRLLTASRVSIPTSSAALRLTPSAVIWVGPDGVWKVPRTCSCGSG